MFALEIEPYLEEFCREDFKKAGVLNRYSPPAAAHFELCLQSQRHGCNRHALNACLSCCACRIEVLVGSATDSIVQLAARGQRFDIAFLDADKTGYLGYYKQLMDQQLIVPGGIIVVDNALMKASRRPHCMYVPGTPPLSLKGDLAACPPVLLQNCGFASSKRPARSALRLMHTCSLCLQGRVYAPGDVKDELADAIREFNEFVIKDERVEVVAMPFRDGVSIIQRRCRPYSVPHINFPAVVPACLLHSELACTLVQLPARRSSAADEVKLGLSA